MKLVSLNPYRTLRLPGVRAIKPEHWLREKSLLMDADWVLFPESWQVDTLEYVFGCRIFPSPATYRLGFDKISESRALEAAFPAHVPLTVIRPNTPAGREELLDNLNFPFVMKQPRASMGLGVALIKSPVQFRAWCESNDVLYAQEYLPIDRDLRIVHVGCDNIAAYWRIGNGDFRNNVARGGSISFEPAPESALTLAAEISECFGINHAGFDIAMLEGHPFVLEFNLLFGNDALNQAGIRVEEHIHRHLLSQPGAPRAA